MSGGGPKGPHVWGKARGTPMSEDGPEGPHVWGRARGTPMSGGGPEGPHVWGLFWPWGRAWLPRPATVAGVWKACSRIT